MRLCAIDVGTNTVQSLVADVRPDGTLDVLADEERFARLGQGVDAAHRLAPEAMDRVVDRLRQAQATADRLGAARTVIGATSASRDAANVGDLQDRVRRELGLDYRVISGEEEAALSFRGALAALPRVHEAALIDVGGGSTEVVTGSRVGGVRFRTSLDVGSVRLSERHWVQRPPSASAVGAAVADVRTALASVPAGTTRGLPLLATGSVARLLARLAGEEGDAPEVPLATAAVWRDRLLGLTPAETLAIAPGVLAGREDVVAAAVLIVATILEGLGAEAYVAVRGGLRHGLALEAAGL